MRLIHAGIVCSCEENSGRFFGELLGMEQTARKILPADLARALFDFNRDLVVLKYIREEAVIEVLIHPRANQWAAPVAHTCLAIADRGRVVEKMIAAGLEMRRVAKGDSELVFVKDFDGNLYELNALNG